MYSIKPKTLEIFNELENFPWFENVGKEVNLEPELQENFVQCKSLEQALKSMLSTNWANFKLEKKNKITAYLSSNFREQYNMWNKVVDAIEPGVKHALVVNAEKFEIFQEEKAEIIKKVRLDLEFLCIVGEYADLVDIEFFIFLNYWYSIGKLPCGWVGKKIGGKILVY
jgi:hypothetical protein